MQTKSHLRFASTLTNILENQFSILGFRFGLEPLLGLIPGLGDVLALLLSLYLIWVGIQMNLPGEKIGQMLFNVILDFIIGLVPIAGDIGDFAYRANHRNLMILEEFTERDMIEGETLNNVD